LPQKTQMNCQLWIYEWWSITTFSRITEPSWMKKPQGFQAKGMDFVNPRGPALTSRPWRRDPETDNPTFVAGDLWLLIHEGTILRLVIQRSRLEISSSF
jgi:hypothetical protein